MNEIHSFWLAALSAPVRIANSPLPPSRRAASSVSVLPMPSDVAWLTKKSRASGSASASHVSTLMPRCRALRSTVEMPARFSTATAMTSTPRVIQFSITSFCRAASSPVGPSQISSAPSSFAASSAPTRQLTKYGIALRLRHHRDHRPRLRRRSGRAAGRARRRRRRAGERLHQPHVGAGHDQRPGDDGGAQHRNLTVFHVLFLCKLPGGLRVLDRADAIDGDGDEQQHAGEHARQLRRQRRQAQTVPQDGEREQAEHRTAERAAPAEHRGAAEHDGGNRVELVAGAGVRPRLSEMRDVDDTRRTGNDPRQHIDEADAPTDGQAREARPVGAEPDRVQRPADHRSVQEQRISQQRDHEQRQLRGNDAPQIPLPEREESRREAGVVHRALGDALGDAAKQRQRPERDDERRNRQPRDQRGVQQTTGKAGRAD